MFIELIKRYVPKNEQEKVDQKTILDFIEKNDDILLRDNKVAHLTSSAIITNKTFDKVLFAHHNIYNSWAWTGGHNDGNPDPLAVAIKEAKEETGVQNIYPVSENIAALDVMYVQNHIKKGIYVGDHLHLNITYILIADETEELIVNKEENSDVRWFDIDEVENYVNEERIKPIYRKVFEEIKRLR